MNFTRNAVVLAAALTSLLCVCGHAQTPTTFTYQGVLSASDLPLTGQVDLRAQLFTAVTGGAAVGNPVDFPNTLVTDGRFTVPLDFGGAFDGGQGRWVEISVRSPSGTGSFTTLGPRQAISPAPQAFGLAGIALTRGGPETVDQAQDQNDIGTTNVGAVSPCWQSWTPAVTGNLTRLRLKVASATQSTEILTVTIHYGRGLAGPVLGVATLAVAPPLIFTVQDIALPNIPVQAGTVYTLVFSGSVGVTVTDTQIPGAFGIIGAAPRNWWFRTFVTPSASINAAATSAASATVAGTAANAISATNAASAPWSGLTGQAAVSTGAIGSGWQLLFSNSANTTFRGGVRQADSGFFEVTNSATSANPNFARLSGAGSWTTVSDVRLKCDITDAQGNLDAAMKLRPVNFRWKADGTGDFGLVAQEVREVLPRLVAGDESKDSLTINYSQLSVVAIGAIQEQQGQIKLLQAQNADLKARLEKLERAALGRVSR